MHDSTKQSGLLLIFLGVTIALFLLILYKVISVPITHDETATTVHYSLYSYWEIMMYPDAWPNNHILNTVLTKGLITLLGPEQWVVRLPNLLSFGLYGYGVWRMIKLCQIAAPIMLMMVLGMYYANAYLLDFFGLCRGYGIGAACVLVAISFLLSGWLKRSLGHIWLAFLMSLLGSYANFSILVFWAAISLFMGIYILRTNFNNNWGKTGHLALLILSVISYLLLIYTPIQKMRASDQFVYWSDNGFFQETLVSLTENWLNGQNLLPGVSSFTLTGILFLCGLAGAIFLGIRLRRRDNRQEQTSQLFTLSFLLLLMTIIANLIQVWIFDTPYLSGRTALFYYPLISSFFLGMIIYLLDYLRGLPRFSLLLVLTILLWGNFITTFNPNSVREWWYDASTFEVVEYLKTTSEFDDQAVSLDVDWHFHRSFHFYKYTGKWPWLRVMAYDKSLDVESTADYYYIFESDKDQLSESFTPVKSFGWDRLLLKRKVKNEE